MIDWDDERRPIGYYPNGKPRYFEKPGKPIKHKPIYCHETKKYYDTYREAARDINGDERDIARVCKGKRTHHKGYHFVFEDK